MMDIDFSYDSFCMPFDCKSAISAHGPGASKTTHTRSSLSLLFAMGTCCSSRLSLGIGTLCCCVEGTGEDKSFCITEAVPQLGMSRAPMPRGCVRKACVQSCKSPGFRIVARGANAFLIR